MNLTNLYMLGDLCVKIPSCIIRLSTEVLDQEQKVVQKVACTVMFYLPTLAHSLLLGFLKMLETGIRLSK